MVYHYRDMLTRMCTHTHAHTPTHTHSHAQPHKTGLFLTIVGFWIIVYTWPNTSCAALGLNPQADSDTNLKYV